MADADQGNQQQGQGTQPVDPAAQQQAQTTADVTAPPTTPSEPVTAPETPPAQPAEPTPTTTADVQVDASNEPPKTGTPGGIVVDKNKTPEDYIKEASAKFIVPRLIREKFPDLVKLIYETESMDNEEREYWLQIMPIMSEQQIVKFRNILVNEKEQLAKLDAQYQQQMAKVKSKPIDEAKMKEKMEKMKEAEKQAQEQEKSKEAELLEQLEGLE